MEIRKISLQEVTQALIAMLMVGVTAFNVATSHSLPDQWVNMVLLVVGFYFGRATGDNNSSSVTRTVVVPGATAILAFFTLPFTNLFHYIRGS